MAFDLTFSNSCFGSPHSTGAIFAVTQYELRRSVAIEAGAKSFRLGHSRVLWGSCKRCFHGRTTQISLCSRNNEYYLQIITLLMVRKLIILRFSRNSHVNIRKYFAEAQTVN